MRTLKLSSIAMLFAFSLFTSCNKDVASDALTQESGTSAIKQKTSSLAYVEESPAAIDCPTCVTNFTPTISTVDANSVYVVNASGIGTSASSFTTIESTKETATVSTQKVQGNKIVTSVVNVTVSHDANNIYFTLERNNAEGGFGYYRFYSPAQIPVPTTGPGQTAVPAGTKKIQIIRSRASLAACNEVSFSFSVGGGGNAEVAGEVTTISALKYILRDLCPTCNIAIGDYRTQTRGYWRNNNGQALLKANTSLFPFTIGCDGNTEVFDNAAEVKTFLESGIANGTPGVLPVGGTLAAQVLTLVINVTTDNQIADFGASVDRLRCLVVEISDEDILAHPTWASLTAWNGKTVNEILALAQNVLGGCNIAYTPSQLNEIVTAINENFDNGTINNGLLTCGTGICN